MAPTRRDVPRVKTAPLANLGEARGLKCVGAKRMGGAR